MSEITLTDLTLKPMKRKLQGQAEFEDCYSVVTTEEYNLFWNDSQSILLQRSLKMTSED